MTKYIEPKSKMSLETIQFFIDNMNENNCDVFSTELHNQIINYYADILESNLDIFPDYDLDEKCFCFYQSIEKDNKNTYKYMKVTTADDFVKFASSTSELQEDLINTHCYKTEEFASVEEFEKDIAEINRKFMHEYFENYDEEEESSELSEETLTRMSDYERRQYLDFISNSH